ncbi:hypothetical protein MKX03_025908 [Papaver bracteatum]|nr:hypothetical protein MKX03_025908 [Papaver bracteatum]
MDEKKVLNTYFLPYFDPTKLPKRSRYPKQLRIMLPMSIWRETCGNHMSQGTKVISYKKHVADETYLGMQVSRFYFKCTSCEAECENYKEIHSPRFFHGKTHTQKTRCAHPFS